MDVQGSVLVTYVYQLVDGEASIEWILAGQARISSTCFALPGQGGQGRIPKA